MFYLSCYYCLSTNKKKLLVSWQFSGPYSVTKYGSGWRKDVVNHGWNMCPWLTPIHLIAAWFSGTDFHRHGSNDKLNARNLHEEWKQFEQHTTLVFKGTEEHGSQEEQCAYLLIWVGNAGRYILNSWGLSEEDSQNIDTLLRRFRDHTAPMKNSLRQIRLPGAEASWWVIWCIRHWPSKPGKGLPLW